MKPCIKKLLGGLSLACVLLTSSCNDEGQTNFEGQTLPENVPVTIYEDFQRSFPEATSVSWSVSEGYAVATFMNVETRSEAGKTSVWYALKDAKKKMQCRTIAFEALPEAVKTAFRNSEYADWTPEATANLLTRYAAGTVETIYVLRAKDASDHTASGEVTLYYTEDGVLVKLTAEVVYDENYRDLEADYRDWLPQSPSDAVAAYISDHYPQAAYLYVYAGREVTKVKILDGRKARLLLFDAAGEWLSTCTQLHVADLPEAVLSAFRTSEYANCRIEQVEEWLTATEGNYYLLTVKDASGHKQEIRIGEGGSQEGDEETPEQPGDNDNDGENNDNNEGDNNEEGDNKGDNNQPDNKDIYLKKTEIDAFLQQRYPDATVTDRDYDEKGLEVELSYNGAKIKVQFELHTQGYVWTGSEWDLDYRQPSVVPAPIRETLDRQYADYQLYFLKYHEMAHGDNYYMAGLKSAHLKREMKVKLDAAGNVLAEYGKH